ncbi:hypothetical protein C1645_826138 [Glomus cerebriforme]|uniref:Uncharacterized protein n=1 Tax=Glomus cerebriforme TaxID=658196 RepID=A0A397T091_9GLOM|nr:hypothetical protein C1645_826138 [Glomus cerebriforme]
MSYGGYGKCNYEDPLTRVKCGCQRFSSTRNNRCVCKHHECYHETLLYPITFEYNQLIPYNIDEMINQTSNNYVERPQVRYKRPFICICLPYENPTKIPRKIKELTNDGLVKQTYFNVDSNEGIKNEIEKLFPRLKTREWSFFRCVSTADLNIANEPINGGWTINELRRIDLNIFKYDFF